MTAQQVRPGTAEQLARVAHFRALEHPEAHELDAVAVFLLGDVGDAVEKLSCWDGLRDDCERLWHLVTEDWSGEDLDEMTDDEAELPWDLGVDACYQRTRERLIGEIESAIWRARLAAHRAIRHTTVEAAAVLNIAGRVR